jgi:hypothetical protein
MTQAKMFAANAFILAADPTTPAGGPAPLSDVPSIDLSPTEQAVQRLWANAAAYDGADALNDYSARLDQATRLLSPKTRQ